MTPPGLPVTIDDVRAAVPRVHAVLPPTALHEWPGLSERTGCRFFLKHENHQPVGAFKVRGAVNLVGTLDEPSRRAGILGVSTGNHGQALAFAGRCFGARCQIVVPRAANPDKVRAIRLLGAELIEHGRDFDEAKDYTEQLARQQPVRYVHSANEPLLIAGVATCAWEIFEQLPAPDVIVVPIGLGSGVCGACVVAKTLRPQTQVIGVQAVGAAAVAHTWRTGIWTTTAQADTWAEGFATRVPAEMTMAIMRQLMDDVILVTDDELRTAVRQILLHTHNLAEGAGAGALAAVLKQPDRFRGRTVVGILSGGNLDLRLLPAILTQPTT